MKKKAIASLAPPITPKLLNSAWRIYSDHFEDETEFNYLHRDADFKRKTHAFFKTISHLNQRWSHFSKKEKRSLIEHVMERSGHIFFAEAHPEVDGFEQVNPQIAAELFSTKLKSALADYELFALFIRKNLKKPRRKYALEILIIYLMHEWQNSKGQPIPLTTNKHDELPAVGRWIDLCIQKMRLHACAELPGARIIDEARSALPERLNLSFYKRCLKKFSDKNNLSRKKPIK